MSTAFAPGKTMRSTSWHNKWGGNAGTNLMWCRWHTSAVNTGLKPQTMPKPGTCRL